MQVFRQTLVHEGHGDTPVLVTYMAEAGVPGPVEAGGRTILEPTSPVVWFTFPGAHHDVGRFHTPHGRLTGYYANILTPVERRWDPAGGTEVWRTTDLFLDVFLGPDGVARVLDADELRDAVRREWVDPAAARGAEAEARRLVEGAREGVWPPPVVAEWPLARARAAAGSGD